MHCLPCVLIRTSGDEALLTLSSLGLGHPYSLIRASEFHRSILQSVFGALGNRQRGKAMRSCDGIYALSISLIADVVISKDCRLSEYCSMDHGPLESARLGPGPMDLVCRIRDRRARHNSRILRKTNLYIQVATTGEFFPPYGIRHDPDVPFSAWLLYDYFLTLSQEKRCIWESRWSAVKVVFLIGRYVALLNQALLASQFVPWFRLSVSGSTA